MTCRSQLAEILPIHVQNPGHLRSAQVYSKRPRFICLAYQLHVAKILTREKSLKCKLEWIVPQ